MATQPRWQRTTVLQRGDFKLFKLMQFWIALLENNIVHISKWENISRVALPCPALPDMTSFSQLLRVHRHLNMIARTFQWLLDFIERFQRLEHQSLMHGEQIQRWYCFGHFLFANISSLISIKPIAVHQNIQRAARNPVLVSKWISTRFSARLMPGGSLKTEDHLSTSNNAA